MLLLVLFAGSGGANAASDGSGKGFAGVLAAAESFFLALKRRDCSAVWNLVSAASKNAIVDDTFRAIERGGGPRRPKEEIRQDFDACGPVARKYWDGFLSRFDPDLPLERSRWERGRIDPERAEILITGRAAEKPGRLWLFLEDGAWKVGLAESFWGRKE